MIRNKTLRTLGFWAIAWTICASTLTVPNVAEAGRPRLFRRLRAQPQKPVAKRQQVKTPLAAPPQTDMVVTPQVEAMTFGAPGVPTGGGVYPNDTPADGEFLKWVDPTGAEWAAGGAGASTLPDLSDVADTLTGNSGDIFSFDGTDWDDQTLEEVFTQGIGNGTDNYVLTTDGAGVIAWEEAPGAGSGLAVVGTPTYGDIPGYNDQANQYELRPGGAPVTNVKDYGASGRGGIIRVSVTAASGAVTASANPGEEWPDSVADNANDKRTCVGWGAGIMGAGAENTLSAPTIELVYVVGATGTNYTYFATSLTGDGGETAASAGTTVSANATLNATNYNVIILEYDANAFGGHGIYGRSSTQANSYPLQNPCSVINCYAIPYGGGDTDPDSGDIGALVTQGAEDTGILVAIDTTNNILYVAQADVGDIFDAGGSTVVTGGPTVTASGAADPKIYWEDKGDTLVARNNTTWEPEYAHSTYARKNSTRMWPGAIYFYPSDNTGAFYRVEKVYKDWTTASSAPTHDTDLGDYTLDGNVLVRRIIHPMGNRWNGSAFISSPPTTERDGIHKCTVTAASTTSITVDPVTTGAATDEPMLHDDLPALQAAFDAAKDAGETNRLYVGPGYYPCLTFTSSSSEWTNQSTGGYSLLYANPSSGAFPIQLDWEMAPGATISWEPFDTFGSHVDEGTGKSAFIVLRNIDRFTLHGRGSFICNTYEEHFESSEANNLTKFMEDDLGNGAIQFVRYTYVGGGLQVHNFTTFGGMDENPYNDGQQIYEDLTLTTGHGNHDTCFSSLEGPIINRVNAFGIGYDSANFLYTDETVPNSRVIVTNSHIQDYRGIFRPRGTDVVVRDNRFVRGFESMQLAGPGSDERALIDGNKILGSTAQLRYIDIAMDNVTFSNNVMDEIQIAGGGDGLKITGNQISLTTARAGTTMFNINVAFNDLLIADNRIRTTQSARWLTIATTGDGEIHDNHITCTHYPLRITSACTGKLDIHDNYFYSSTDGEGRGHRPRCRSGHRLPP